NWKGLLWTGSGLVVGLGLAAAYLYPAAIKKHLIRSGFIAENWPYHESYVFMATQYVEDHKPFFNLINRTWSFDLAIILIAAAALLSGWRALRGSSHMVRERVIL